MECKNLFLYIELKNLMSLKLKNKKMYFIIFKNLIFLVDLNEGIIRVNYSERLVLLIREVR